MHWLYFSLVYFEVVSQHSKETKLKGSNINPIKYLIPFSWDRLQLHISHIGGTLYQGLT